MSLPALLLAQVAMVSQPMAGPQPLAPLDKMTAAKVLPPEMADLSDRLPAMFAAVNRMAKAESLEGWPEPRAPFAGDSDQSFDPFHNLHPTIYRIWANVRVLWIHPPGSRRWDALLLMKVGADKGDEQYRMMWLHDAFGHPLLEDAKSGQPWEWPDVLEWQGPDDQDTTLTYARTIEDLQRSWSYTLRHSTNALSCAFPETDVGQSYRFDPDLGLGSVIENVGVDVDDEGTMAWTLTPEEFQKCKVIVRRIGFIWVQTPNGLGVASNANWDQWTAKFKNTHLKP